MNKKLASTILFFLVIFAFSQSSLSQNTGKQPKVKTEKPAQTTKEMAEEMFNPANLYKKRLSGFNSVYPIVYVGSTILKENGLTSERITTDVEIKLRQAQFEITSGKWSTFLSISVDAFESRVQSGLLVYSIKVELNQNATLERDVSVKVPAVIWERSTFGTVGSSQTNVIRETIKDFVDEFILDYLKANETVAKNTSIQKNRTTPPFTTDTADLFERPSPVKTETDSPFRATYVGGNAPPEVEIFNDSDRTMYIDLGQGKLTAYTILSKQSISLKLVNGNYNYKASAARVSPLQGINEFRTGYRYTWRFTILKR